MRIHNTAGTVTHNPEEVNTEEKIPQYYRYLISASAITANDRPNYRPPAVIRVPSGNNKGSDACFITIRGTCEGAVKLKTKGMILRFNGSIANQLSSRRFFFMADGNDRKFSARERYGLDLEVKIVRPLNLLNPCCNEIYFICISPLPVR
jgi:hypothetical protein